MAHRASLPTDINNWDIDFDPYGYARSVDWTENVEEQEDVLQLSHVWLGLVLDVGHYGDGFVVQLIKDERWDEPMARHVVQSRKDLTSIIDRLVVENSNPS